MKNKKRKNNVHYSKLGMFISLLLFVVMIFRVIQLGLSEEIDGINIKELAAKRTTKTDIISAQRGNIYSSDGELLAQNVTSYKLIAYLDSKRTTNPNKPQHVVDKEETAEKLAPILGMEKDEILHFLSKEGVYQTEFGVKGKGLNEIVKRNIEDLNLPGLDFIESYKRYYPKGEFASYIIGYTKTNDDSTMIGEMGIEKQYDAVLHGKDGFVTYQKDLKGYKIADTLEYREDAIQGKDVYLTINSSIQFFVEQAITNSSNNYGWEWMTVTVMDAKTGAILAMASDPDFNPNTRNITNYLDNFCQTPYEPGSTMKTFTYMAAMENGVYDGNETYLSGTYQTQDGTVIGDWDRNGWGVLSFDTGYVYSSNVGVINLINRHMNSTMLRQYYRKLGFGKKTGIELPNENRGKLNFKYETEIYNAGFGQGILTTPVQNVKAMTPLTNDGILLEPYLIEKIVDPETGSVTLQKERTEIERVASTQTVQKMLQLMDVTVNNGITGSGYKIDSEELIGKTGTAQIANENGGGYLSGKEDIISSFSGIYPKSDPQIIIYASVKKPSGGSQKAISSVVKEVVTNISKYYGNEDSKIPQTISVKSYNMPSFINKKVDNAKVQLDSMGLHYVILGAGFKVIDQIPVKDSVITTYDTIYLFTNDSNIKMPNVVGLSSREADDILKRLGIRVSLDGVGYVVEQSIAGGSDITSDMEVTLTLKSKYIE